MNLSKTVIPVLSNNFARNEWCLFQLAVARNKITKAGNLSIFPIMLDEIEFQHMNSALYSLIKLSSYAAWDEDENKLFPIQNLCEEYTIYNHTRFRFSVEDYFSPI
jgi:toll-like receptor 13